MSPSSICRARIGLFLLATLAGCDGSQERLEPGTFVADVRGDVSTDLVGAAQFETFESPSAPEEGFFAHTVVTLGGAGEQPITIAFYEVPRVRSYVVEQPTTDGAVALVNAKFDGDSYYTKGGRTGTVTVTRVSEADIEGEFDVPIVCCGSTLSNTPFNKVRLRGRFSSIVR